MLKLEPADIDAVIARVLALPVDERRRMGAAARRAYEVDRHRFTHAMHALNHTVCGTEDHPDVLRYLH
jgi:hypothetical protein